MLDDKFTQRFHFWLRMNKLNRDPFASFEADQERPYLSNIFVDRPYFYEIAGDPRFPRPAFLFAGRGEGKTATREMVAYECHQSPAGRKALPVRYFDFASLLELAGEVPCKVTLRLHVQQIIRCILKSIAEDVPSLTFDRLSEPDRSLLAGYATAFADPRSKNTLLRSFPAVPASLDWQDFTPLENLQNIAELIARFEPPDGKPYLATYILVDRVDETSAGREAAFNILRPLISSGPVLETPYLGFKFFLPAGLSEQVRQAIPLPNERVVVKSIEWDRLSLERMIDTRLKFFSDPFAYVSSLVDLCKENARHRVVDQLVTACDNSPRTLLRLCHMLLENHVLLSEEAKIDKMAVSKTINDFIHQREAENLRVMASQAVAASQAAARAEAKPAEIPPAGLFMDSGGHVYIDGKLLSNPLTDKENELLGILYARSPDIVPQDTLIEAIWKSAAFDRDSQNLRKLIARLRLRLEPDLNDRESRFIKSAKRRGYWLERG